MKDPVRYREARRFERFEPYAFTLAWPVLWFGPPMGLWVWVVVFVPDLLNAAVRRLWRSSPPVVATARRSESGVELEGLDASVLRIAHGDVDSLTAIVDRHGRTTDVRLDRKSGRALVFEVVGDDTLATLASRLGLDASKTRSRYTLATWVAPRGTFPLLSGLAIAVYTSFIPVEPETAYWLRLYVNVVVLPLAVVYAIGTQLDVGHDGIAWRWLFVRKYLPFSAIAAVSTYPRDATVDKVGAIEIACRNGASHRLMVGKQAAGAWLHLREAFAASQVEKKSETPVDEWLPRAKEETDLAWTRRLRAMASSDGGYRGVSLGHLWSVAEDLDAAPRLRAGALLVLASNDAARERIRILATHVVDPALSTLLEAIAADAPVERLAKLVEAVADVADVDGPRG